MEELDLIAEVREYPIAVSASQKRMNASLLVLNRTLKEATVKNISQIYDYFKEGDVLVVNNSATLPASFKGFIERTKEAAELRLASSLGDDHVWVAALFADGSWTEDTESREDVKGIRIGDRIMISSSLIARVNKILIPNRMIEISFETSSLSIWTEIYSNGKPIQYSYLTSELKLWDHQTLFSGPPLSVEPPSALFQFMWEYVNELHNLGVIIVPITHAAGLSSTGNNEADKLLPLPERYIIPDASARILNQAIANESRIIAIGTTVVRALESNFQDNLSIKPGEFITDLVISDDYSPKIFHGLVSGMHMPSESHINILKAFCNEELLEFGYEMAVENGMLWHEYGDLTLIIN